MMNDMADGNSAAERELGIDDMMSSYLDDACEREQERIEWRNERRDELKAMTAKDLTDRIGINLDCGEVLERLIAALTDTTDIASAKTVLWDAVERVLDVEQEQDYGR